MNIYYKLFIGYFIFLGIFFIIAICKRETRENFTADFKLRSGNDFQDNRFEIYNQNSNEPWKELPVESNNPIVQNYGTSYLDMYKMNQYIFNDFEKKDVDAFVKKYSDKLEFDKENYLEDYTPFDIYNLNKDTWFNRYNWDPNYVLYQKYIESKFDEVNDMNKLFLMLFNRYWFDFIANYVKRNVILQKPYYIMKYRILQAYSSKEKTNDKPNSRIFETIVTVTRDDAKLAFEFYLTAYFELVGDKYEMKKLKIQYISNYTLDQVLIREGIDKHNLHYNLNPLWSNDNSFSSAEVDKLYAKGKDKALEEKNALENSYVCFAYDKGSKKPYSQPIYAVDRHDCENRFTLMGYEKPPGVWDKPCKSDSECMFYGQNKNYKNSFGKCYRGYCELPLNMKPLGYHYYIDEPATKPLCYNCNSKKWLPNTQVDFCCDEQKDKKKYPFLKGPDYAFKGDGLARYNRYMQQQCTMKPSYDNVFKKTSVWKVNCKGFLDTYLLESGQAEPDEVEKIYDIENA